MLAGSGGRRRREHPPVSHRRATGRHRRAHRPLQPPLLLRSPGAGVRACATVRPAAVAAHAGHRRLQAVQRPLRPPGRRPGARRGGQGAWSSQLRRNVDFAARYGGEEFVVLLPNTSRDGAEVVGQRLVPQVAALDAGLELPPPLPDGARSVGERIRRRHRRGGGRRPWSSRRARTSRSASDLPPSRARRRARTSSCATRTRRSTWPSAAARTGWRCSAPERRSMMDGNPYKTVLEVGATLTADLDLRAGVRAHRPPGGRGAGCGLLRHQRVRRGRGHPHLRRGVGQEAAPGGRGLRRHGDLAGRQAGAARGPAGSRRRRVLPGRPGSRSRPSAPSMEEYDEHACSGGATRVRRRGDRRARHRRLRAGAPLHATTRRQLLKALAVPAAVAIHNAHVFGSAPRSGGASWCRCWTPARRSPAASASRTCLQHGRPRGGPAAGLPRVPHLRVRRGASRARVADALRAPVQPRLAGRAGYGLPRRTTGSTTTTLMLSGELRLHHVDDPAPD